MIASNSARAQLVLIATGACISAVPHESGLALWSRLRVGVRRQHAENSRARLRRLPGLPIRSFAGYGRERQLLGVSVLD